MSAAKKTVLGDIAVLVGTIICVAVVIVTDLYRSGTLAVIARVIANGSAS